MGTIWCDRKITKTAAGTNFFRQGEKLHKQMGYVWQCVWYHIKKLGVTVCDNENRTVSTSDFNFDFEGLLYIFSNTFHNVNPVNIKNFLKGLNFYKTF